ERVLISHGPGELWFLNQAGLSRFQPPRVKTVNPIGCGDCLAAGIAAAFAEGRDEIDAIRFGMAAAADHAGQRLPARIDRSRTEALTAAIKVLATSGGH